MTILFITKLLPYPLDAGGKLKTYRILQLLARKHTIHFVSFIDRPDDRRWEKEIRPFCASIKTCTQPVVNNQHMILKWKYLASIFSLTPFTIYKYYSHELLKHIENRVLTEDLDAIYIDHFAMAQYFPKNFQGKVYLDEHNISYGAFQTYEKSEKNIFMKCIYAIEKWKLRFYEDYWVRKFDHIFAISELDRKRLIEIGARPRHVSFLPTPFSSSLLYKGGDGKIILFTGLLSWLPNEKGLHWFIENVFPFIQEKIPGVKFIIAGKNGERVEKYVQGRRNKQIEYLGYVENLTRLYKSASVFVVPIQMGGGVRIKLLEALSVGLPVVSTIIGAEGIDVENGRHILLADSPDTFARAVISILKNKHKGATLSHEGYACIRKNYSRLQAEKVLQKTVLKQ